MIQTQDVTNGSTVEDVFGDVEWILNMIQQGVYTDEVEYTVSDQRTYGVIGNRTTLRVQEWVHIHTNYEGCEVAVSYGVVPAEDCDDELLDWEGNLEFEYTDFESLEDAAEQVEEWVEEVR